MPRFVLLVTCLVVPVALTAQPTTTLTLAISAELERIPAKTAVYLKHLETGEEAAVRADDSFNSQSVIKIPIMVRAFQLAEQRTLNLDERVTLGRVDLRDGSGIFQFADLGLAPTLRDLIQQMIITSDNTATDVMTTKVGGVDALNAWLAQSGYKMRLINRGWEYRRKLLARLDARFAGISAEETTGLQYAMQNSPLFAHYESLFTGPRARWLDVVRDPANRRTHGESQLRLMVEDRNIWLGDMTAHEIGRMLEAIERESLTSAASAAAMRTFMRRQLAGSRRLPHFLDVSVAHKTGDSANIANDVGIIYSRSGPIVIAVMVNGVSGSLGEAEDRIGRLAQLVVDYFDNRSKVHQGGRQDSALGTFTVNGKTTRLTNVYATMETSPLDASQKYLILLVTNVPVAATDRSPGRLVELARSGALHAVKLRWRYGADDMAVVPYHSAIGESGRAFASMSTVNLSALDDKRVNAEFKSKMLGQTWFFNAIVKAAIVSGGTATLEPDVEAAPATPGAGRDVTSLKRALGGMGYEFTPDAFFQAIGDRKPAAVALFIQAGMSPHQKNDRNTYALNHAVLFCAYSPAESAEVIKALLDGKADVKTKDPDNGTTALVGAVQSCTAEAVAALVKAGSDLSAKSNGGMTALQLARIFSRSEVVEVLEKAGAK